MTNKELNRDIKRLYKKLMTFDSSNLDKYFQFVDNEFKKEFLRLYHADNKADNLTKDNLLKMIVMNRKHQNINPAFFYINAEPKI